MDRLWMVVDGGGVPTGRVELQIDLAPIKIHPDQVLPQSQSIWPLLDTIHQVVASLHPLAGTH